jgi:SAM-dependent methyltransferase
MKKIIKQIFSFFGFDVTKKKKQLSSFKITGEFIDSRGYKFQLLNGYRNLLWGMDWEGMNKDRSLPTPETIKKLGYLLKGRDQVADLVRFLSICGYKLEGRDVLEIGCFDGAACYALTEMGARFVHGIDYAEGFIPSIDPTDADIDLQRNWHEALRDSVRQEFMSNSEVCRPEDVTFSDQDISNLVEKGKYDLVLSISTLEHVLNPKKAFKAMFDALRPGGISYHNYHPFFCINGGHFDTCDFPWGHVRLNNDDFRRYISAFRPNEVDISEYRFFRTMNRLTLKELKDIATNTGFKVVEFYSYGSTYNDITPEIYSQCKDNYKTLTLEDLTASNVTILLEKPL